MLKFLTFKATSDWAHFTVAFVLQWMILGNVSGQRFLVKLPRVDFTHPSKGECRDESMYIIRKRKMSETYLCFNN